MNKPASRPRPPHRHSRPTISPKPSGPQLVAYQFPLGGSQATFEAKIADMTIDEIVMAAGTYHFSLITCNVDRTARPLTIRPATPGTVTFAGDVSSSGQFQFGNGGAARYITMEPFIFDGYSIGDTGVIWCGDAQHMTLKAFTVRNVTVTGQGTIYSWALYLSKSGGVSPHYIDLDGWNVTGTARNFSALQCTPDTDGAASIHATNWTVDQVGYAIYADDTSDLQLSGWTITNSWRPDVPSWSVHFGSPCSGTFHHMTATNSGGIQQSLGGMTDGGNNSGLPINP